MKKAVIGILAGIVIGVVVVCLFFGTILWINEQRPKSNDTETVVWETENSQTEQTEEMQTEDTQQEDTQTEYIQTEDTQTEDTQTEDTQIKESETQEIVTPDTELKENTHGSDNGNQTQTPDTNDAVTNHPYYIRVNRTTNCITIYTQDENGNYTVPIKAMACSVGRNGRTPVGVFQTSEKYIWRELYGNCFGQYATRITGHVLFHSVPYYATQKDRLITSYYNKLGTTASSGCIRLSVADAKWIYDNCAIGVMVEIFDSNEQGPLAKPVPLTIDTSSPYAGWDPTDPDPGNPWKTVKPIINGVKDIIFERNEPGDYLSYVNGTDSWGNQPKITVQGEVDFKTCGTYPVTYSAVDAIGNVETKTAMVVIRDTKAPVISQILPIAVTDCSVDIEEVIKKALMITDNGEIWEEGQLFLDLSNLINAMERKNYGKIICYAIATDAYENKTDAFCVEISYEM